MLDLVGVVKELLVIINKIVMMFSEIESCEKFVRINKKVLLLDMRKFLWL